MSSTKPHRTTYTDRNPTDDTPIATEALNLCYCSGTAAAVTTSTGSVGVSTVVYQICGDATQTTTNYIQPSWSADPSISAAAQVIFGDLNPLDLINSISSQCVTACPTTGTAKASYFPVNEPATGTITTDGATSTITVTYAEATAVDITYSVSAKMQNVTDRDYLFDVVNVLSKQGSTQATMNYRGDQPALQAPFPSGVTTQYVGPGSVGVDRWQNVNLSPDDYSSLIDSLSISFSSKLEGGSGLTCSESKSMSFSAMHDKLANLFTSRGSYRFTTRPDSWHRFFLQHHRITRMYRRVCWHP